MWLLTAVNLLGVREAGYVQIVTTVLRLIPLIAVGTLGLLYINPDNLTPFNVSGGSSISAVTAASALTLWALLGLEAATVPGKGKLTLTGRLGDWLKESANAAFTYIRSRSAALSLDDDFHEANDIHIHYPGNALKTDGPSAGIAMATAILVVGRHSEDAIEHIIDFQFNRVQQRDLDLVMYEETDAAALAGIRSIRGVVAAEPFRSVAVRL